MPLRLGGNFQHPLPAINRILLPKLCARRSSLVVLVYSMMVTRSSSANEYCGAIHQDHLRRDSPTFARVVGGHPSLPLLLLGTGDRRTLRRPAHGGGVPHRDRPLHCGIYGGEDMKKLCFSGRRAEPHAGLADLAIDSAPAPGGTASFEIAGPGAANLVETAVRLVAKRGHRVRIESVSNQNHARTLGTG